MSRVVPITYLGNQVGTAEVEVIDGEVRVFNAAVVDTLDILQDDFKYYSIDDTGENLIDCE